MAENKNLDELNMLQNDGKIDTTVQRKEDRKDVESVAKGKKTIDEVPQAVTVELLKEHANKNKVFSKIEDCCEREGIDPYKYFIRCFGENDTVSLDKVMDEIAVRIPTLIKVINGDEQNNLYLNGNGEINVELSITKALRNGRTASEQVQNIAEDAGKNIENEKRESAPVLVFLQQKDEKFFRDIGKEMNQGLGDAFGNILESLGKKEEDLTVNVDGKQGLYDKNHSKEDNIILNKFNIMKNLLDISEKFSHNEASEYIVKLLVVYKECAGMDLSNSSIEGIEEIRDQYMKRIEKTFKALTDGLKIDELSQDENWDKVLHEQLGIVPLEAKKIEEEYSKEINEEVLKFTEKASEMIDAIRKSGMSEGKEDAELNKLLIYAILEKLDEEKSNRSSVMSEFASNKSRISVVDNTLKSAGEDYVTEAKKSGLYKTIKSNVNTDIYLDLLKREMFESRLDDFVTGKEYPGAMKMPENVIEWPVFALALDMIDGDKSVGYTEKDMNVKERAIQFIKSKFPDAFDKDNKLDRNKLFELVQKKYSVLNSLSKVKNFDELFDYVQDFNNNAVKSELTIALRSDAKGIDMSGSQMFSLDKFTEILSDEKNLKEVRSKVKSHRAIAFENRVVDEIENGFMELYNARNNPEFTDYERRLLVKKSLIMYDHFPTHLKNKMLNPENCDLAKKVLMEYIPEVFVENGTIGSRKSKDIISEFFYNNGEILDLKSDLYPGVVLLNSVRAKVSMEKIDYSPEELKKRAEEVKIKKETASKKISSDYDTKILKYIKLLKEQGAKGEALEELNKLENILFERIERKNPNGEYLSQVKNELNNTSKNEEMSAQMARTTRRVTAFQRVNELRELHKDGSKLSEEELKEVFNMCAGLRNDYSNEQIDVKDYKKLMMQMSYHILKQNGYDFIEKSKVNDEKFLEAYNKLFGTKITDINAFYEEKSSELIAKGISRAISDIDEGKKGLINSALLEEVSKDDFEPRKKIADYRNERTTLDIKDTSYLAEDVLKYKKISETRELTRDEKYEYVQDLVILAKILKEKSVLGKVSESNYPEFNVFNQKLSTIVKNELIEIFPEAFTKETGHLGSYQLKSAYMKFLQDYGVPVSENSKDQDNLLTTLILKKREHIRENSNDQDGRVPLNGRLEGVTSKLDEVLQGTNEEKNIDIHLNVYALVKDIEEKRGIKGLTSKLFENHKKSSPELYGNIDELSSNKVIDDSCMYRMAVIKGGDILLKQNETIKHAKYVSDNGRAEVSNEDKVDMILTAFGTVSAMQDSGKVPCESERIALKNAKSVIKELCPQALINGVRVNEIELTKFYNSIVNNPEGREISVEELKKNAEDRLLIAAASEITRYGTIDSRYNEVLRKNSVTREKAKENAEIPSITGAEFTPIYKTQAEVIVVDEPEIAHEESKRDESEEISADEIGDIFDRNAVELGETQEEVLETVAHESSHVDKTEQSVETATNGMQVETMEVSNDSWRENLPVEQPKKGFFANILDNVKAAIGTRINSIKEKIFGTNSSDISSNGTTGTGTSSSSGGVNKAEQTESKSQDNNWIQQVNLDVKAAQDKAKETKQKDEGEKVVSGEEK